MGDLGTGGKGGTQKSDSSFERDLSYNSRGRGLELGDLRVGMADFSGKGTPEDNSQDNDVNGMGYSKSGTFGSSGSGDMIKSNKQPSS